jgi:hypothetical protein
MEWTHSELVTLMHQAIVECHVAEQSRMALRKIDRVNSRSVIQVEQLQNATFHLSPNGTIKTVAGLSKLSIFPPSSYQREHVGGIRRPNRLSHEKQAAIIARTEPPMPPLISRHMYTPTDASFLDATLEITHSLTLTVSPSQTPALPPTNTILTTP